MKRLFLRLTHHLQTLLWKCGIPWHNPFTNECTPDFDCCMGKVKRPVPPKKCCRECGAGIIFFDRGCICNATDDERLGRGKDA